MKTYYDDEEFTPTVVERVSVAAKSLCMWCRAMEVYGRIAKDVAPKRAKLQQAMKTLEQKQKQLQKALDKVKEIEDKVLALREKYDESTAYKDKLKQEFARSRFTLNPNEIYGRGPAMLALRGLPETSAPVPGHLRRGYGAPCHGVPGRPQANPERNLRELDLRRRGPVHARR